MKATLIRLATGQRALLTDDKALRIYPDTYSQQQRDEQWKNITTEQRNALIAEAANVTEVEYDEHQTKNYGRPIWH